MSTSANQSLNLEWDTLQNNIEQYEKGALVIKLTGVLLCAVGALFTHHANLTGLLLCVLWLQEGIYRTSQSRLVERIVRIETHIRTNEPTAAAACQLHTEWRAMRPGMAGLVKEYLTSALRPTVAFPYVVLIVLTFAGA